MPTLELPPLQNMNDFVEHYAKWTAIVLATALLVLPPLVHIWTGWRLRRTEIVGQLSGRGIRLYFLQFHPAVRLTSDLPLWRRFQLYYGTTYGRRHYIYPLILLVLIGGLLVALTIERAFDFILQTTLSGGLPYLAAAAVAGAYLWVVLDLIGRSHSRELSPFDVNRSTLRLVVAIPIGYAFTATFGDGAAWLALLLGAFPLEALTTYARKIVNSKLNLNGDDASQSQLLQIDGISKDIAQTLQNVGIDTVNQLAVCDPIDLAIRTGYAISFIADCVSQAIAWSYFKSDMTKLRKYLLRGAVEIYQLTGDINEGDADHKANANKALNAVAVEVGIDVGVLWRTFEEDIAGDPHTQFVSDLQTANAITSAAVSQVNASKLAARPDGQDAIEIRVLLRSADGREVRGDGVLLTSNADVTIRPESVISNQNGIAAFSVTSTTRGDKVLTATDADENIPLAQKLTVTFG